MSEQEKNIGGLWLKESNKTGKKYMSGNIEIDGRKIKIVVFKNTKKDANNPADEKKPDYRIFESKPMQQQAPQQPPQPEVSADEIPF
jgi:hypothetical protein